MAPTLLQGTLRSCTNTYSGGTRTSTRGTVVWSFSGGSNWAPASGRIVGSTIVETFQTSYRYFTSDGTSVKDLVSGRTVALLTPRSTWTRYDFNAVCS